MPTSLTTASFPHFQRQVVFWTGSAGPRVASLPPPSLSPVSQSRVNDVQQGCTPRWKVLLPSKRMKLLAPQPYFWHFFLNLVEA